MKLGTRKKDTGMVLGANEEAGARLQRELLAEAQASLGAERAAAAGDRHAYSLDI